MSQSSVLCNPMVIATVAQDGCLQSTTSTSSCQSRFQLFIPSFIVCRAFLLFSSSSHLFIFDAHNHNLQYWYTANVLFSFLQSTKKLQVLTMGSLLSELYCGHLHSKDVVLLSVTTFVCEQKNPKKSPFRKERKYNQLQKAHIWLHKVLNNVIWIQENKNN